MKKIKWQYALLLTFIVGFIACQKGLSTYSGGPSVYFTNNKKFVIDTLLINFADVRGDVIDSVISVSVSAGGMMANTDRVFKVSVADNSTAQSGVNYVPLTDTFKIPANSVTGQIYVKLLRSKDLQNQIVSLTLLLQPNDNFQTPILTFMKAGSSTQTASAISYKIVFTDMLVKPELWDNGNPQKISNYLGYYSRKKYLLMSSLVDLPVSAMNVYLSKPTSSTVVNTMEIAWGKALKAYLIQQKALKDTIKEDDGTVMAVGASL